MSELLFSIVIPLALGAVAIIHWLRHKQPVGRNLGFTLHWWSLGDLGAGLLISFLAMAGIFLVELAMGWISVAGTQFDQAAISHAFGLIAFGAVYEELFFRSLLLSGLVVLLGGRKWLAIAVSAVYFGLVHITNPGASLVSAFGNALGGVIYGMAFLGGRNIWLPLGLHFSWNFSQGPIFGFPVSGNDLGGLLILQTTGPDLLTGGAYGPEAGLVGMIFRFVIMALVIVYLQWRSGWRGNDARLAFPIRPYTI